MLLWGVHGGSAAGQASSSYGTPDLALTVLPSSPLPCSYGALGYEQLYLKESGAPGILLGEAGGLRQGANAGQPQRCMTPHPCCRPRLGQRALAHLHVCRTDAALVPLCAALMPRWCRCVPKCSLGPLSFVVLQHRGCRHGPAGGHLRGRDGHLFQPRLVAAQAG